MKRKALLSLFILMANLFVVAQNQKWEVHFGVSNKNEYSEGLIEYYDKGYYIEGTIGMGSGWQVKSDINGNMQWNQYLEHPDFLLQGWSVAMDNEGNRYVAGVKFNEGTWPFVSKFTFCSDKEWCRIIADAQLHDGGSIDILINENDEIIVLSNYMSFVGEAQIFLECFDKDGEYLWKKHYARQEDHPWIDVPVAYDLMEHKHEYYISGYCYWPFPSDTTHYFLRPLFIGIDSLFNEKWILPFYALDSVFGIGYQSIAINDSLILGVGIRRYFGNIDNSLFALYNTNGKEISYSIIPNEIIGPDINSNEIREIERINDTLFLSCGFFGSDYSQNPVGEFVTDIYATLYNHQSHPNVWGIPHIIKTSDNNYVIASTVTETNNDKNIFLQKIDKNLQSVPFDTNTYTYDSLCPEPIQSGTIDLSDCMVWTGAEEIPSPEEYYNFIATIPIAAYPNPAETEITLAFQNTEHHTNMLLECYSIYGQKVHSEKIYKGQQQTKLNVNGWSKGLYLAVVRSKGKVAGTERFVRK